MKDKDILAKIDSLQSDLSKISSVQSIRSDLHSEVKEHKEYLESLMNKAVRVMSLIAAFLIGVTAVLGVKTYWDVEERLTTGASEQVERYLTREFITSEFEDLFERKFQVVSILEIITRIESFEEADSGNEPISDADIEQITRYINEDESDYLSRLLDALAKHDSAIGEHRETMGAALMARLARGFDTASGNKDSRSTQEVIIRAIAKIRYRGAYEFLRTSLESDNVPVGTKVVMINALPNIVEREQEKVLASVMLKDIKNLKEPLSPLYSAQLAAAYALNAKSAVAELRSLILSDNYDDAHLAAQIIMNSDVNARSSELLSLLIASPYTNISYRVQSFELRPAAARPLATFMIQSGDTSWSGVALISELTKSRHFSNAISDAFETLRSDPERLQTFMKNVAAPMAEYGAAQLEFEKRMGFVGQHANPMFWQDSIMVSSSSSVESSGILLSVSSGEASLLVKKDSATRIEVVPITSITSITWKNLSFESRIRDDPFR